MPIINPVFNTKNETEKTQYDLIIIGGGPAGLAAGIYASRARLSCAIIERLSPGGQIILSDRVENYPGFVEGISGTELGMKLEQHARKFGTEFIYDEVTSVRKNNNNFEIITSQKTFYSYAVIIATGASYKHLDVPGEKKFTGKGVSFCATCDGAFFKNKNVAVIGGGDTAIQEAIYLTKFASKVFIIHRRDALRATRILQDEAFSNPKITFIWNSVVREINGKDRVESLKLENIKNNEISNLATDGVFIFVGIQPHSEFVKDLIKRDENGYIIVDANMQTSVPGIFAAGDVIKSPLRQVVTSVAEGAIASFVAEDYIRRLARS